jgi:aminodeoxyfutalosine synthase
METLTHSEAAELVASRDLIGLGVRADDVRRATHGTRTTFVRVFEMHVGAVPAALPPRVAAGEIRLVGRPASVDAALVAVRAAAAMAGPIPVTGFSISDLDEGMFPALRAAGLSGLADVALDALPDPALIGAARRAGLLVTRLVVNTLVAESRIDLLERARELQDAVGGFNAFAPLPRTVDIAQPTTGFDDVKQVALARLVCRNIGSIQVDWALYGPKLAQVALTVGADDVDGVAAVDPGTLGTRRSPLEEIRGNIRAAGLEPIERNARFERLA